jgi:O-antigen ligase
MQLTCGRFGGTAGMSKVMLWEKIFTVTGLFLSTYAVIPLLRKQNGVVFDPFQGDLLIQFLWAGIYAVTFFLVMTHWRQVTRAAFLDKFLWLLLGLAFLSIAWSGTPVVTLRRCAALFGTTTFGVYLAARYTREELLRLLLWALGACAILSVVFALLLPSYGIHPRTYHALRGVYENKNILGCFMALAALTWLLYSFSQSRGRMVGITFFLISIALLLLSKSITAFIVFFLLFIILVYYSAKYYNIWALRPFIIFAVGSLFIWLYGHFGIALDFLGRDATLTGRTLIWQEVWRMILQRPWLGYGYSAFWLGWNGPSSYVWNALPSKVISAHSGFLDLWLQLGLAGVCIFLISFFSNLFKAQVLLRQKGSFEKLFPLLFFLFIFLYNISESAILMQNSLFWILYAAISIQLRHPYCGSKKILLNRSGEKG